MHHREGGREGETEVRCVKVATWKSGTLFGGIYGLKLLPCIM